MEQIGSGRNQVNYIKIDGASGGLFYFLKIEITEYLRDQF
jgi:hypothetical protein